MILLLSTGLISRLIEVFRLTGKDQKHDNVFAPLTHFPQFNISEGCVRIMTTFLKLSYSIECALQHGRFAEMSHAF